jgi:F0F1-type ATP synthase delta subunit
MQQQRGTTVRLTNTVDASLVGGAAVRFGDHVLDRSVHSLLEAIGRQLYETSV